MIHNFSVSISLVQTALYRHESPSSRFMRNARSGSRGNLQISNSKAVSYATEWRHAIARFAVSTRTLFGHQG